MIFAIPLQTGLATRAGLPFLDLRQTWRDPRLAESGANLAVSMPNIKAGKVRALAVTSAVRAEPLPDVPTVSESVPGFVANGWTGIGVPRGTPPEIIDKLNREINAALADPEMRAKFIGLGVTLMLGTPADFAKHIAEETEKWTKVVKFSGARIQ